MIKLISPIDSSHPKHKEIMNLYWYMLARVLPFYPEDIFPEDKFNWNDKEWKTEDFYKSYPINWKNISKKTLGERKIERKQRALTAKEDIGKYAKFLYEFLYDQSDKDGHVIKNNLTKLLCEPCDFKTWKIWKEKHKFREISEKKAKEKLQEIFNYDFFTDLQSGGKKLVHRLIDMMNVEVCPYCNRNYTTTYQGGRQSELDHYRPKSEYPYFAVSLLNLIPSCKSCNHSKSNKTPGIYPYNECFGKNVRFVTKAESGINYLLGLPNSENDFRIEIEADSNDDEFLKRLENSKKAFHLEDVYQSHKNYVTGMFRQRYYFGEEYLESIRKSFSGCGFLPEEILYNHRLSEEYWGQESLGKLTFDINEEINRLTKKK